MFRKLFKKKPKVKVKSLRRKMQPKEEWLELGKEIANLIANSNNPIYSYIAKTAIEQEMYNSFLDIMSDVMEVKEDMILEMVGQENVQKMWNRIYELSK